MTRTTLIVFAALFICIQAQRSPYAGRQPIGFPTLEPTVNDVLGNRFGEDATGTTERLPMEALGDRDFVNRISKLPLDQQPFWYINWRALEEHRRNMQTYPQKVSPFIERSLNTPTVNNQIPGQNLRRQSV